jgi:ribonuclease HI
MAYFFAPKTQTKEAPKPMIHVFTDGACLGNPGPGGWGVLIQHPQKTCFFSGHEAHTTNNRMELTAAIRALEALSDSEALVLFSDSQYVIKGITEWSKAWEKNGWKNSKKKDVENSDLWKQLVALSRNCSQISWQWVKGHHQCTGNIIADRLASRAAQRIEGKS